MNRYQTTFLILVLCLLALPLFSQEEKVSKTDSTLLSLPGDNLDLFAVLDLFQKSPSIEDFEKSLNSEDNKINNLDLNLDEKVDFIKVITKQEGNDFTFILQVDVSEKEIQDVAVIIVSKDENDKVFMQIVGDKDLYGENYVVEPAPPAPKVTANPAYTGTDPVESTPATSTVVVVESAPIVQYVYSPVYVPYYPPYYYAYYPPYYRPYTVIAVGVYHNNHYHNHYGYHGGYHGNTVVIHNHNTYNNYNNSRQSSNTVNHNKANGNYNRSSASTRPSTTPSNGQSRGSSASTRPSTTPANSQTRGSSAASRPANTPTTSQSRGSSSSARPAATPSSGQSRGSYASPSRSMGTSRSTGGGGGGGRRR